MLAYDTTYVQWAISVLSLVSMYLIGNKSYKGWTISIFSQVLWLLYIVGSGAWGLFPSHIGYWVLSIRNYRKWKHEALIADNFEVVSPERFNNYISGCGITVCQPIHGFGDARAVGYVSIDDSKLLAFRTNEFNWILKEGR